MPSIRAFAVAVAVTVWATPALAGMTCARELAVTETSLIKAAIRLQSVIQVSPDEKCATYRAHASVITKAREVFERCSSGRDREQDVGQMDSALSQDQTAIASACTSE